MKVYALFQGAYSGRGLLSIHRTAEQAKAAAEVDYRKNYRERDYYPDAPVALDWSRFPDGLTSITRVGRSKGDFTVWDGMTADYDIEVHELTEP